MKDTSTPKDFIGKDSAIDNRLIAGTIGDRQPLNSTIELAPYNPDWPSQFLQHANQIREALGDKVLLLEHVGSTSVPRLAAKPIIDIVLAVIDSANEPAYVLPLEEKGFVLRIREPDWFEHRMFKAPEIAGNLHVFSVDCSEIDRMILFRNWLRDHDDDRLLYEQTKRDLAAQTWKDIQYYADAKTEVVREILDRAIGSIQS
jgi:GrpB-like predicted nucleotidyltransferase (UPF0157 family)